MRGATRSAVRFLFRAAQSTAGRTGEVGIRLFSLSIMFKYFKACSDKYVLLQL